jgi:hypothetical protein
MFALGTREAVVAALLGESAGSFGAPVAAGALVTLLARLGIAATSDDGSGVLVADPDPSSYALGVVLAHAHGWAPHPLEVRRFSPRTP